QTLTKMQWFYHPPRSCDVYWCEFKHCKSLFNRFHEYYTYGRAPDCQQWKEDYYTCKEWEKTHSTHAKESLQESERKRVAEQRKFTPVWELRQTPPADWHVPLNQGGPHDS
uniref:Synaptic plasticity regulator PANTS n=1 Tax=Cyprinus carpio TaxID=7962 RepID=A0A8C1KKR5_CYPCA